MGRTKGTKNGEGHKAGGKRPGSGRKPRQPDGGASSESASQQRNGSGSPSSLRPPTTLDNVFTAQSSGDDSQDEERFLAVEGVHGRGRADGEVLNVGALSQMVRLSDVHPDIRQLVVVGQELDHRIPIVSFFLNGPGTPLTPLSTMAAHVLISLSPHPSSPSPATIAPAAMSSQFQHHNYPPNSLHTLSHINGNANGDSQQCQGDQMPTRTVVQAIHALPSSSPSATLSASGTPHSSPDIHSYNSFLNIPSTTLMTQLPGKPNDSGTEKRKRRRCVVCMQEGDFHRAFRCPGRGNRSACPFAKTRMANLGIPTHRGNVGPSTTCIPIGATHHPHMALEFPAAHSQFPGGFPSMIPHPSQFMGIPNPGVPPSTGAYGYHRNGTVRVRRPRRCRICVERGEDGTLCLGRQAKEKCRFYVLDMDEASSEKSGKQLQVEACSDTLEEGDT